MQHEVLGGAATTRALFARTMGSSPHLRALVRELYLNIRTSQYPLQLSWLNLLPPGRLLKAHILFSEGRSSQRVRFQPWILGFPAIRSVHHLKLHCSLQPHDFEVCFGLPNVQSLDLSRPAYGTWCLPTLATLPPTLERLTLSADDLSRPRVAARLVGMVALAPSVRELSIKTGELGLKGAFSPIAEQLVRIRHLRVLELDGCDVKKLYPDRLVEAIVNRNRSLKRLVCAAAMLTGEALERMPRSLQVLEIVLRATGIEAFGEYEEALAKYVRRARPTGMDLEKVVVRTRGVFGTDVDGLLVHIKGVCEANGVVFHMQASE